MPQIINQLDFVLIGKQGWSDNELQPMIEKFEKLLKKCSLHIL